MKSLWEKVRRKREARKIEKEMYRDIYRKALQDEKVKLLKEKARKDAEKQVFKKSFLERLRERKQDKKVKKKPSKPKH